jgi:hypothetical protein
MSTASIPSSIAGGFNYDHLLEGTIWAGWLGWTVFNLNQSLSDRQKAVELPESSEKATKVWNANKKLFVSSCSCASASSIVFAWFEKVGVISAGIFSPIFGVIGFGGGAIASLVQLIDAVINFNNSTIDHSQAKDPVAKRDIALGFLPKVVAIAFLACATAWGILGGAHIILGGVRLALLVDQMLKYTIISFLSYFGSTILVSLLASDSKNLSPKVAQ